MSSVKNIVYRFLAEHESRFEKEYGFFRPIIKEVGEGVMLISYNVDNCEESLEKLKKNKVRLIDQKPRYFAEYKRNFAFIHPAATHGVLTEIIDGKY